jgi:hypothetical protein
MYTGLTEALSNLEVEFIPLQDGVVAEI